MAGPKLRHLRQTSPYIAPIEPAVVDESHPYAAGLKSLWLPSQSVGVVPLANLAPSAGNATTTLTGSPLSWITTPVGAAPTFTGLGNYLQRASGTAWSPSTEGIAHTIAWFGQFTVVPTATNTLNLYQIHTGTSVPNTEFWVDGVTAINYEVGTTLTATIALPPPTVNQPTLIIATVRASTDIEARHYNLSTGVITTVLDNTVLASTASVPTSEIIGGNATLASSANQFFGAWFWNRGFSSNELAGFLQNPFSMLEPRRYKRRASVSASGALTGTSASVSTGTSGTASGKGALSGASAVLSTSTSGTVGGKGALTGTSAAVSTATVGTLVGLAPSNIAFLTSAHAGTSGGATSTITLPVATAAGAVLVLYASGDIFQSPNGVGYVGVTSNVAGTTFIKVAQAASAYDATHAENIQIWVALNAPAGTHTVTVDAGSGNQDYGQLTLAAFSGVATASAVDQTATKFGTSVSSQFDTSLSLAASTKTDEVVVAGIAIGAAGSSGSAHDSGITTPTNYTSIYLDSADTRGNHAASHAYRISNTVGTEAITWGTLNSPVAGNDNFWVAALVSLKAASPTSAITGTSATLSTGIAGALTGNGSLSGTSSATATGNGTLTGTGALAGNSAAVSTGTSGIGQSLALSSATSAALSTGISATLTGKGVLAGTSAALSTGIVGIAQALAFISGTAAALSTGTAATLTGKGAITGTSAAVTTGTSGSSTAYAALTGTAAAISTGSVATLSGIGALVSSAITLSTATGGTLSGAGALAASSAALSTGIAGTLAGSGALAVTSTALSGAVGSGISYAAIAGTSAALSTGINGSLTGKGALSSTATALSGATGAGTTTAALTGTSAALSTGTNGLLGGNTTLAGTSAALSTGTSASLGGLAPIAGTSTTTSSATASLSGTGALVSSSNAISTASGAVSGAQASLGQTVNSTTSLTAGSAVGRQQSSVSSFVLDSASALSLGSFNTTQLATPNSAAFLASSIFTSGAATGTFLATPNGANLSASSILFEGSGVGLGISAANGATFSRNAGLTIGGVIASKVASYPGALLDVDTLIISGGINGAGETLASGQDLVASASLLAGSPTIVTNPVSVSVAGTTRTATASVLAGTAQGITPATAGNVTISAASLLTAGAATGQMQAAQSGAVLPAIASLLAGASVALGAGTTAGVTLPVGASLLAGVGAVTAAPSQSASAGNALLTASAAFSPGGITISVNTISNTVSGGTLAAATSYVAGTPAALINGLPSGLIFVNAVMFIAGSFNVSAPYLPREKVKSSLSLSSARLAQVQFKTVNQNTIQFKDKLQAQSMHSSSISACITSHSKISATLTSQ